MTIKQTKQRRSSDYRKFLYKRLQDPELAAGYLTASLAEGEGAFLVAVKDVAEARGGIAPLARRTRLNREGLYAMLSEKGNPRLSSLSTIMDALNMRLQFAPKRQPAPPK